MRTYLRSRFLPVQARSLVLLLLLALVIPAAPPKASAAVTDSVTFEAGYRNLSGPTSKAVTPWVAVDSNDKAHVVYFDTTTLQLLYTNNVNGTFGQPVAIENNHESGEPFLVIGPNNSLHLGYSSNGEAVYYRTGTLNGATVTWSSRILISNTTKTFVGQLAVDGAGNAHFVWLDQRCGEYNVFYRVRLANGTLGAVSAPKGDCTYQTKPRIALTSDGKPQVAFERNAEIYYARLESTGWVGQQVSDGRGKASGATIASDGTAIYIAWGVNLGNSNHDVLFRRSIDGGQNWSTIIGISINNVFAQFPAVAWAPGPQRVYIAWSDKQDATDTEIWFREFDPETGETGAARRLTSLAGASDLPVVAVGSARAEIVWQDRGGSGNLQIFHKGGPVVGGCAGTLQLDGGNEQTKTNPVPAVITPTNCSPTQMQVSVDTPPTDSTPKVAYASSFTVSVPTGGCAAHKVYVKLYQNENSGNAASDSITVDTVVTATVRALNPHMRNLASVYTPMLSDAKGKGASDGHPDYTRDRVFFLSVADNGDCAGLQGFDVEGGIAGDVPDTGFVGAVALPGSAGAGPRDFQIEISDKIDNTGMYPSPGNKYKLIYDPPSTSPTTPNSDGVPVLAGGGSVVGSGSGKSIERTLTFSGINVTDNLYGQQGEGLPAGRQFWGVWAANSRNDNDQDNGDLNWVPVEVETPAAAFSISWNLFSGLDYGADLTKSGEYYVYIRFLDGAGNPTAGFLKVQMTLEPGYSVPVLWLPVMRR